MKKQINAQIVADSIGPYGDRITTYLLTFPRFILAELNTHRMFSRNSASSRAIPFEKMLNMVEEDPFIPIAWQRDHKGMQGNTYLGVEESELANQNWLLARDKAIEESLRLSTRDVTKQLCNRLLEPFMWHTALVTATEYDNFFELRCPIYRNSITNEIFKSKKDFRSWIENSDLDWDSTVDALLPRGYKYINESQAEIHIQALAEAMWDAMNESTPRELKAGEYHIPFGDKFDLTINSPIITKLAKDIIEKESNEFSSCVPTIDYEKLIQKVKLKIATARCARLSYMTFDGEIDYEKDIELHDRLLESGHMSPFEHCARAMSDLEYRNFTKTTPFPDKNGHTEFTGWCNNFKGWIPYRYLLENK